MEVFGSAATGDFDESRSDIDLVVEVVPSTTLGPWLKAYFALQADLEEVLGRPVDLVMNGAPKYETLEQSMNE